MQHLTHAQLTAVVDAIITSGMNPNVNRPALLFGIDTSFTGVLSDGLPPKPQVMSDLGKMNITERLTNGQIPLIVYLANAAGLVTGQQEQVIRETLDFLSHKETGGPKLDKTKMPETKEKIIHTDDTVTFGFMDKGVKASKSVMKLYVPSFENGVARQTGQGGKLIFLGTGWLLTESLLMTNHHVINARRDEEDDSSDADFLLQGMGTTAEFDFDAEGQKGTEIKAIGVEAWNKELDYAIVRIATTGRPALTRSKKKIILGADAVPVNIIQHPGGKSKRYGIRNNLVIAATDTELRYFTDTETGSSGSPVLNDRWEVVALHRASLYVTDVKFQGKSTAYVNVGTHLISIAEDVKEKHGALAAEIGF